jgi:putative SOS response-associated peptidase YedK
MSYHCCMCARFAYYFLMQQVQLLTSLGWSYDDAIDSCYNVAPTMDAPVILIGKAGKAGLAKLRWGLVPSWADDPSVGVKMFNARSETIREKPAYREAFEKRRCVVPISGFYEWEPLKELKRKKPWFIAPTDGSIMLLAGIWERWGTGESRLDTYSVVTTDSLGRMAEINSRSPVMLEQDQIEPWLRGSQDEAMAFCKPAPPDRVSFTPVSSRVGNVKNNDPSLVERVENDPGDQLGLF